MPPLTKDWRPPTELPDLRRVGTIAIDIESNDEGLRADQGSAWPWHGGYICGISVAWRDDSGIRAHYFPLRHPDSQNFDPAQVFAWVKDLAASGARIITQNGLYDWGWLRSDGGILMPPGERIEEISALAAMVDENRYQYGLDALCKWRGLPGKDESLLRQAKAAGFQINKKNPLQSYIWQLPARYVGPYAEADPIATLALFENLNPILDRENTRAAYRLECDLLPMVLETRLRGVRVDVAAAEQRRDLLFDKRDAVLAELSEKLECPVSMHELRRNKWLADTFDHLKITYPRTAKGNPSFTSGNLGWMGQHPHWVPQSIATANKYNKAASDFLQNHILDHAINGRIYAEIHPHRSEDNGTKSFRFSYSDPPLQQMPSRDPEITPLVRGCFLPEEGETWATGDCSQQEFRDAVHYAAVHNVPKANIAQQRYVDDPDTDFHAFTAQLTGLDRKQAKNVNFAKMYGAGVRKFAAMIGRPEDEAKAIYNQYDRELPFLRALSQLYQSTAQRQGYITLYDGARRHFDKWAPGGKWKKGAGPCEREEAERRIADPDHPWFGKAPLYRADAHNALNALIQGTAARHTKLWMRACWREGIVPLLQMHDALECSVSTREQAEMVAQLGVEAIKLRVPMRIDLKFGRNWGDAKHSWEELHGATPKPIEHTSHSPAAQAAASSPASPETSISTTPKPQATPAATPPPETPFVSLRDIVREFGVQLIHNKVICPFHDDHEPSCHIYHDHFFCFVCRANGDAIAWLMEVESLTNTEAVDALESFEPRAHAPEDDGKTLRTALALWEQAQPIASTLAEYYLISRHIDVTQLPADVPLRFHPHCIFGAQQRHPCLLALLRDVQTDAPAGILRTALTPDGKKIDRKSLGRWHAPRAIKLWPAGETLIVGEGVETVLAAATRMTHEGMPLRPAWATAGTARLETLPPIQGAKRLIVLADNDDAGRTAARRCGQTAANAGCTVQLLTPTSVKDFNDIVRGRAA